MREASNRASRDRRVLALLAWSVLILSAFNLWNSRLTDSIFIATPEPIAFVLAAFGAFVGVFAWMLFNPGRRSAAESPELFFAAIATLFPPPIIAFCLMPADSPLRWWLAIGIFALCVIAVLSDVPDEFFAVPRNRATYLTPIPTFDKVYDGVMDPHAEWFTFQDLSRVVKDVECPSLSPRAYLQQEASRTAPRAAETPYVLKPVSDVDDILGADFDEDFMADDLLNGDSQPWRSENHDDRPRRPENRLRAENSPRAENTTAERHSPSTLDRSQGPPQSTQPYVPSGPPVYDTRNQVGIGLAHRELHRPPSPGRSRIRSQRQRIADSIHLERTGQAADAKSLSQFSGTDSASTTDRPSVDNRTTDRRPPTSEGPSRSAAREQSIVAKTERETFRRTDDSEPTPSKERSYRRKDRRRSAGEAQQRSPSDSSHTSFGNTGSTSAPGAKPSVKSSPASTGSSGTTIRSAATTSATAGILGAAGAGLLNPSSESAQAEVRESAIPQADNRSEAPTLRTENRLQRTDERSQRSEERTQKPEETSRESARQTVTREQSGAAERSVSASTAVTPRRGKRQVPELDRIRDEHGAELIEGVMKVRFDRDQKRANLHVPFSPPLAGMPDVECECVGGENLRLKVPVKQSYGIRIEARRSDASEPLEADISFAAVYSPE